MALFEWGAILTYFYWSGRLSAFLHPSFRPMILVAGPLLLIAAMCLLFSELDGLHVCEAEGCDHVHEHSSRGGVLRLLVLMVPIALASGLSPDGYGIGLIQNRGVTDSLAEAPVAAVSVENRPKQPISFGDKEVSPKQEGRVADIPAKRSSPASDLRLAENTLWNRPLSSDGPSSSNPPAVKAYETQGTEASATIPVKADNEPQANSEAARAERSNIHGMPGLTSSPERATERSKADAPCSTIEVLDLLIAAHRPALMNELCGKRVEVVGQVLPGETNNFQLVRLLIVCCAADAQPLAVMVNTDEPIEVQKMGWVKVTGKVAFEKKGAGTVPVIAAEKITPTTQPAEPYLSWKELRRDNLRYRR